MSLADLKKNRQNSIKAISEELEKFNKKQQPENDVDARFWYPAVDKAGNGNAVIRFLPAVEGETIPFVRYWEHSFQGPTGLWFFREMCPTTKGKNCPICDYNRSLWNSGDESKKKLASKQKRKLNFVSNILVLKDPANPENEGTVRLYRYGQKIWNKISEKMHPDEALGEEEINPFDFWEGCNFTLKIRNVEDYRNYDSSSFATVSPLSKDDKFIEKIWKQEYPLQPFVADELFHDEAWIKERLNQVLGLTAAPSVVDEDESPFKDTPSKPAKTLKSKKVEDDEDEIDEAYFERLTAE